MKPTHLTACNLDDFPAWRKQRQHYAVWTLLLEDKALTECVQQCQQHFAGWLHPQQRQAHITVFVAGFPSHDPQYDDCISWQTLAEQQLAIQQLSPASFELQLTALESFQHAPYLALQENNGDRLNKLRQTLAKIHPEQRYSADYLPHITLGLYRQNLTWQEFVQRRSALNLPPITWQARTLHLHSYDARDQLGKLHSLWSYTLND